ncbi:MAG: glycerol-3-phosphate dehydrogenase/oxidase [Thermodesulfobacteriota bacterium]|nr:glycerol-3-phosphate dehydrogenase/oxidase [Thermodesulfobacteriota bacterium]
MAIRDLKKLSSKVYDILVVGGGAHGATVACHAAKAGYTTAIVEKNDFCGATSANSLKILHGGLRYLQHFNIQRMRHSITARREMMQLAPHLVQPLACLMPLYGKGLRGKRVMQTALFLNDCIGWDRNQGLSAAICLPGGHILSKNKCLETVADLENNDLHGAAVWYDALAIDTERLIIEYILESLRYGAKAVNYTEATALEKGDGDLYHVTIRDLFSKEHYQLKTKCIVNAAGPWFEQVVQGVETKTINQKWALALNIVSKKKIFDDHAVALEGVSKYADKDAIVKRDKRLYFFVPWRDHTMIGTEYVESNVSPDNLQVKREMIQDMVDEVNSIYPSAALEYKDISFYHAGLLPMRDESEEGTIQLEKNSSFFDHSAQNFSRVISIKGVKYTTAPYIAHEVVRLLSRKLQPQQSLKKVAAVVKPPAPLNSGHKDLLPLLENRYGTRSSHILSYIQVEEGDAIWIDKASGLLKAELKYLINEEMACKLSDVILRRTGFGTAGCPDRNMLAKVAEYMGESFDWDKTRRDQEIAAVMHRYHPLDL